MWLLAGLLPLQALAALAIAARGPAHTHLPAASTRLVLDDFRRTPVRGFSFETHETASSGHAHNHEAAARHHHVQTDPTVVVDAVDRLQADDADDASPSPGPGLLVGPIPSPLGWLADPIAARADAPARWQPRTHQPALPERPPRAIA